MIMLLIYLALIGFLVYALTTYIPMPEIFKIGIYILSAIMVIFLIMRMTGFQDIPIGPPSR